LQAVLFSRRIDAVGLSGVTAMQAATDASLYVAGFVLGGWGDSPFPTTPGAFQRRLDREFGYWTGKPLILGPSTGFISHLSGADGELIESTLLGGRTSESISGLALDAQGRVVALGTTSSYDFPATGVFQTRCGPDRGRSNTATFLARLDARLERVERSMVGSGLDSTGLTSGPLRGSIFLILGGAAALVDLDRDDATEVACVVSGASYEGLSAVTPGQLVTVFGRGLGPRRLVSFETGAALPEMVEGIEVLFNGARAPILAALDSQLNVVAPFGVEPLVWMEVKRGGERVFLRHLRWSGVNPQALVRVVATGAVPRPRQSPLVLLADALNEDGSSNTAENPAPPGSLVTVFATGLGRLEAPIEETGYGDGVTRPVQRYLVRTAAGNLTDVDAVTVPGRTLGVTAVRFRIPDDVRGTLEFSIDPDYAASNFAPRNFLYVAPTAGN
jgi:uncharacterized protein (TIGR03437 family)